MTSLLMMTLLWGEAAANVTTPEWTPDGQPLNDNATVLLDAEAGRLWLKTTVSRQTGVLEMFLCRTGTKEHESVVAINSPAFVIHGGLLALGLEPGKPATFDPEFQPPTGAKLNLTSHWTDDAGKRQSRPASEWMRRVTNRWYTVSVPPELVSDIELPKELDIRYFEDDEELIWFGPMSDTIRDRLSKLSEKPAWQKALVDLQKQAVVQPFEGQWVFAGSTFWNDPDTDEQVYLAESGNVICVANFGDAMIDIDIESSSQSGSLLYEPWTERVPAVGTVVWIEISKAGK